jgi:7-cyano-7-deazaguanine synthase
VAAPVTVLMSGGLDSMTCVAYYREQGLLVSPLWVDYGQVAAKQEEQAAVHIARHYGVELERIAVQGIRWPELGGNLHEYRARNLMLVALAVSSSPVEGGLVALGVHAGTPFADCAPAFAERANDLISLLTGGGVQLDCPFVSWTKDDIARYAVVCQVPAHLAYSCERGVMPPCGECEKCKDLLALRKILDSASA